MFVDKENVIYHQCIQLQVPTTAYWFTTWKSMLVGIWVQLRLLIVWTLSKHATGEKSF